VAGQSTFTRIFLFAYSRAAVLVSLSKIQKNQRFNDDTNETSKFHLRHKHTESVWEQLKNTQ
jgi:hypothetical protein